MKTSIIILQLLDFATTYWILQHGGHERIKATKTLILKYGMKGLFAAKAVYCLAVVTLPLWSWFLWLLAIVYVMVVTSNLYQISLMREVKWSGWYRS